MSRASFIRSFLLRGTAVFMTTLSLLFVMGWRCSESTGSEAIQPPIETTIWIETATTTEANLKTTYTSFVSTSGNTTTSTTSLTTTSSTTTKLEICSEVQDITSQETVVTEVCTTSALDSDNFQLEEQPTEQLVEEHTESENTLPVTDYEYKLLCKIVCSEYGGMADVQERAKIVASVMNQSARMGKSIEQCLYQTCVPWGFNINGEYFCGKHYTDMADAVDYYFANRNTVFADWDADSWYGSGYGTNIFHRQLY